MTLCLNLYIYIYIIYIYIYGDHKSCNPNSIFTFCILLIDLIFYISASFAFSLSLSITLPVTLQPLPALLIPFTRWYSIRQIIIFIIFTYIDNNDKYIIIIFNTHPSFMITVILVIKDLTPMMKVTKINKYSIL